MKYRIFWMKILFRRLWFKLSEKEFQKWQREHSVQILSVIHDNDASQNLVNEAIESEYLHFGLNIHFNVFKFNSHLWNF